MHRPPALRQVAAALLLCLTLAHPGRSHAFLTLWSSSSGEVSSSLCIGFLCVGVASNCDENWCPQGGSGAPGGGWSAPSKAEPGPAPTTPPLLVDAPPDEVPVNEPGAVSYFVADYVAGIVAGWFGTNVMSGVDALAELFGDATSEVEVIGGAEKAPREGVGIEPAGPCAVLGSCRDAAPERHAKRAGDPRDPIHPISGEFRESWTDLWLPGVGLHFELRRTYSSQWTYDGPLGHGWTHNFNQRILELGDGECAKHYLYLTGRAVAIRFDDVGGELLGNPRIEGTLIPSDDGWVLDHPSGESKTFDSNGLLVGWADRHGNTMVVDWEPSPRPDEWRVASVTDTVGRVATFDYDEPGRLSGVSVVLADGSEIAVQYVIDDNGDLVEVKDPDGFAEWYEYYATTYPSFAGGNGLGDPDWRPQEDIEKSCQAVCDASACGTHICESASVDLQAECLTACEAQVGACTSYCLDGETGCRQECANQTQECRDALEGADRAACDQYCSSVEQWHYQTECLDALDYECAYVTSKCASSYIHLLALVQFWADPPSPMPVYSQHLMEFLPALVEWTSSTGLTECSETRASLASTYGVLTDPCENSWGLHSPEYDSCMAAASAAYQVAVNNAWTIFETTCRDGVDEPASSVAWCDAGDVEQACRQSLNCDNRPDLDEYCLLDLCNSNCDSECDFACGDCGVLCAEAVTGQIAECVASCEDVCVSEAMKGQPEEPVYGYYDQIAHNLVRVTGPSGVYLENTYEKDMRSPNYDRVVKQIFGEHEYTASYYDLAQVEAADIAESDQGLVELDFAPLDVCPCVTPPAPAPDVSEIPEIWVPVPGGGVLVLQSDTVPADDWFTSAPGMLWEVTSSAKLPEWLELEPTEAMSRTELKLAIVGQSAGEIPALTVFSTPTGVATLSMAEDGSLVFEAEAAYVTAIEAAGVFSVFHSAGGWVGTPMLVAAALAAETEGANDALPSPNMFRRSASGHSEMSAPPAAPMMVRLTARRGSTGTMLGLTSSTTRITAGGGHQVDLSPAATALTPTGHPQLCRSTGCWFGLVSVVPTDTDACSAKGGEFGPATPGKAARYASVLRDGEGRATTYYGDAAGRLLATIRHEDGSEEHHSYDGFGRLAGAQTGFGNRLCREYDAEWNVSRTVHFPAEGAPAAQEKLETEYTWLAGARLHQVTRVNSAQPALTLEYDTFGNLSKLRRHLDSAGGERVTEFPSYDYRGRVLSMRTPLGDLVTYEYEDVTGQLSAQTVNNESEDGSAPLTTLLARDSAGRLAGFTPATGPETSLTRSAGGLVVHRRVTRADGTALDWTFEYDDPHHVSAVAGPEVDTFIEYNAQGLADATVWSAGDSSGEVRSVCRRYDSQHRVVESIDTRGTRTQYLYGQEGGPTLVRRGYSGPTGAQWEDECAVASATLVDLLPHGAPPAPYWETWQTATYAPGGLMATSNSQGIQTEHSYDGYGRHIQTVLAAEGLPGSGTTMRTGWDDQGDPAWAATLASPDPGSLGIAPALDDPNLLAYSEHTYDGAGRLTSLLRAWFVDAGAERLWLGENGWASWTWAYDDEEREVALTDAAGLTSVASYDPLGRQESLALPGGEFVTWEYLNEANVVLKTRSAPTSTGTAGSIYHYNDAGQLTLAESAEGVLELEQAFDPLGRLVEQRTPTELRAFAYSGFGERTAVLRSDATGALDAYEEIRLDWGGASQSYIDGRDNATLLAHDGLGRISVVVHTTEEELDTVAALLTTASPEDLPATTYSYLPGRAQPDQQVDVRGVRFRYSFDVFGEVWEATATTEDNSWLGQRVLVRSPLGIVGASSSLGTGATVDDAWVLDSLGLVRSQTSSQGADLTYEYGTPGQLSEIDLSGEAMTFAHDIAGRLASASFGGATIDAAYGPHGGLSALSFGNGLTDTRGYGAQGRVIDYSTFQGAALLRRQSLYRHAGGAVARIDFTRPFGTYSSVFSRDDYGRLAREAHALTDLPPMAADDLDGASVEPFLQAAATWERHSYDAADNRVLRETDLGSKPAIYGELNELASIDGLPTHPEPNGAVTSLPGGRLYDYDAFGQLEEARAFAGTWSFTYDALGRLRQMRRTLGRAGLASQWWEGTKTCALAGGGAVVSGFDGSGVGDGAFLVHEDGSSEQVSSVPGAVCAGQSSGSIFVLEGSELRSVAPSGATDSWVLPGTSIDAAVVADRGFVLMETNGHLALVRYAYDDQSATLSADGALMLAPYGVSTAIALDSAQRPGGGYWVAVLGAAGVVEVFESDDTVFEHVASLDLGVPDGQHVAVHGSGAVAVTNGAHAGRQARYTAGEWTAPESSAHTGPVSSTQGFSERGAGGGFFSAEKGESLLEPNERSFTYASGLLIRETDKFGTRTYVPGPGGLPMAVVGEHSTGYLHYGWGRRVDAISNGSGELVEAYDFNGFMAARGANPQGAALARSAFGIAPLADGGLHFPQLGLYRFGARWYDPASARWLTPDPIGFGDGPNVFSYVGNMPLDYSDPSGLKRRKLIHSMARMLAMSFGCSFMSGEGWGYSVSCPNGTNHRLLLEGIADWSRFIHAEAEVLDGIADWFPPVGALRGAYNALEGEDLITERELKPIERVEGIVDAITGGAGAVKNGIKTGIKKLGDDKAGTGSTGDGKSGTTPRGAPKASRTWCFPAGTQVHTPDGLTPIEEVEPGQLVLAADESTGAITARPVHESFQSWTSLLVQIRLEHETIRATGSHPFWVVGEERWVDASHLEIGMAVRLLDGGEGPVLGVGRSEGLVKVYNLDVDTDHTYFVGETGALVHNGGPEVFADYEQARNAALEWLGPEFKAESQVMGKFGPNKGQPIGMKTADGKIGFRVEFDARNKAHINVWNGKSKEHIRFKGSESMVNKIVKRFGC